MEAFVRSIELGGFSAAARELKLSPSALSKLVSRLERTLGARLLNRTTRKLTPTAEGELFLARCRRVLGELEDAETEIGRSRERPRGKLRLHVGVGFATHQVVPTLPRFQRRYPEVQIELLVEDRDFDLVREGIDISVRPGPPRDQSVVARKLGEFERVLCAAPDYLAQRGTPRSPDELAHHSCITLTLPGRAQWPFDTPAGRRVMPIVPSIGANNNDCVLQLALLGLGIVHLNDFIVARDLRARRLVRVLREYHCTERVPMYALYPQDRHRLPRVAVMLEFLAASYAESKRKR
ncbi:MAG: LysR substrate-binding domain-containing protein [Burkholderiales bacterium]